MNLTLFDIETKPRPDADLDAIAPAFEAPGNYKDPDKIRDHIAEQKRRWKERAALSPLTGEVLAIGLQTIREHTSTSQGGVSDASILAVGETHETEAALLRDFLQICVDGAMGAHAKMGGWNIRDFDIPFIVRRAWHLNVPVHPALVYGRYLPAWMIDLRDVWGVREHQPEGTLAQVGAFLGCGTYASSGKDFAQLWADPATRNQAVAHLAAQLSICVQLAERFGVVRAGSTQSTPPCPSC